MKEDGNFSQTKGAGEKSRKSQFVEESSNVDSSSSPKTPPKKKGGGRSSAYKERPKKYKKSGKKRKKSKGSWLATIGVLLIVVLLIGAVFFTPFLDGLYGSWSGVGIYPEKADYTMKRTIKIENNDPRESLDYKLTLAVPYEIEKNNIQTIENTEWNGEPDTIEKNNHEWRQWDRTLASGQSERIEISYDVKTTTVKWDFSGEDSGTVEDIPQDIKDRYIKDQWAVDSDRDDEVDDRNGDGRDDWMIEPSHPKIERLAEDIVSGEDNIYDKSKAIYDWMNDNIKYEFAEEGLPKHAVWVLNSGTGDCDEQSFLYTSLSRAAGIPAWLELGVLYDRGGDRWGGHGWVRTRFVNDAGTKKGWVNIDLVNDEFFFRSARRFTTWVDDGQEGHLKDYYYFFSWTSSAGISRPNVDDEYENMAMDTEGRVVYNEGKGMLPGFEFLTVIPATLISIFIYSRTRRKRRSKKRKDR
ncbi:MAG: transglutaminase domain-containing protein [Candidatus Thermoplasmatota archaeon]|nr:transglutaminase domain-containing protein [Candidatus Thermoplasmatota archaeon]